MIAFKKSIERLRHGISHISSLRTPDNFKQLETCHVLLFCHDVDRPINLYGRAYSPLLDSVREDFESRGLVCRSVAHFGSSLTGIKGFGEPVSFNRGYIWYLLKQMVVNLLGMAAKFKNNPFVYMLEKTGAQLVVTIGSPTELASAARSKGVFHVELLHGIGYAFVPWGWDKLSLTYLPQGILSLDEVSTKSFTALKAKGIDIYTIPHPFLKKFILDRPRSLPSDWKISTKYDNKYFKRILVSLTWGYAGDHGSEIQLSNILSNGLFYDEVKQLVSEDPNIFWHFRFHPVQLRKPRYKNLLKFMDDFVLSHPNSEWREASIVPFPNIVSQCDGNIGMASMSCYDAAAMGVPSLMLCPTIRKGGIYQDYFTDLENEGYVTKAKVTKEILRNWVHKTHKIQSRLSNLDDDASWEDSVKWMLQKSGLEDRIKRQDIK